MTGDMSRAEFRPLRQEPVPAGRLSVAPGTNKPEINANEGRVDHMAQSGKPAQVGVGAGGGTAGFPHRGNPLEGLGRWKDKAVNKLFGTPLRTVTTISTVAASAAIAFAADKAASGSTESGPILPSGTATAPANTPDHRPSGTSVVETPSASPIPTQTEAPTPTVEQLTPEQQFAKEHGISSWEVAKVETYGEGRDSVNIIISDTVFKGGPMEIDSVGGSRDAVVQTITRFGVDDPAKQAKLLEWADRIKGDRDKGVSLAFVGPDDGTLNRVQISDGYWISLVETPTEIRFEVFNITPVNPNIPPITTNTFAYAEVLYKTGMFPGDIGPIRVLSSADIENQKPQRAAARNLLGPDSVQFFDTVNSGLQ